MILVIGSFRDSQNGTSRESGLRPRGMLKAARSRISASVLKCKSLQEDIALICGFHWEEVIREPISHAILS